MREQGRRRLGLLARDAVVVAEAADVGRRALEALRAVGEPLRAVRRLGEGAGDGGHAGDDGADGEHGQHRLEGRAHGGDGAADLLGHGAHGPGHRAAHLGRAGLGRLEGVARGVAHLEGGVAHVLERGLGHLSRAHEVLELALDPLVGLLHPLGDLDVLLLCEDEVAHGLDPLGRRVVVPLGRLAQLALGVGDLPGGVLVPLVDGLEVLGRVPLGLGCLSRLLQRRVVVALGLCLGALGLAEGAGLLPRGAHGLGHLGLGLLDPDAGALDLVHGRAHVGLGLAEVLERVGHVLVDGPHVAVGLGQPDQRRLRLVGALAARLDRAAVGLLGLALAVLDGDGALGGLDEALLRLLDPLDGLAQLLLRLARLHHGLGLHGHGVAHGAGPTVLRVHLVVEGGDAELLRLGELVVGVLEVLVCLLCPQLRLVVPGDGLGLVAHGLGRLGPGLRQRQRGVLHGGAGVGHGRHVAVLCHLGEARLALLLRQRVGERAGLLHVGVDAAGGAHVGVLEEPHLGRGVLVRCELLEHAVVGLVHGGLEDALALADTSAPVDHLAHALHEAAADG